MRNLKADAALQKTRLDTERLDKRVRGAPARGGARLAAGRRGQRALDHERDVVAHEQHI